MLYVIALGSFVAGVVAMFLYHQKRLREETTLVEIGRRELETTKETLNAALLEKATHAAVIPRLESDLEAARNETRDNAEIYRLDLKEKDDEIMRLREEAGKIEERIRTLEEAEKKLTEAFAAASQEAIKNNAEQFLQLAKTQFEGMNKEGANELGKKEKAIADLLSPIQEKLAKLDESTRAMEKERSEAYGSLTEQVKSMMEAQQKLEKGTNKLVTALRNPHQRGQWGEFQLRRVVEMAGMVEHCDFQSQVTKEGEDGRLRPDIIVKMPNDRVIVVDAKVPFESYSKAVEGETEEERKELFAHHARQVRQHIEKLSRKSYHQQFESTPEFVVMFLPAEPMFSAALESDPGLVDFGVQNQVLICTPITLIALLKAVAAGWRQEQLHENAMQIGKMARDLHKRVGRLASNFAKLGRSLNSSINAYNESVGSLEGSVLPQMRKFTELDSSISEDIEEPQPVNERARVLQAPELKKALPKPPGLAPAIGSLFEN